MANNSKITYTEFAYRIICKIYGSAVILTEKGGMDCLLEKQFGDKTCFHPEKKVGFPFI